MAQEQIFSDYSGGMNALAAVDKLDAKECLLAENVRLDETGNIASAGAFTHQNTAAYAASGGGNQQNVHSLFWNPSLGGVAGVGQDVFTGTQLGSFVSALAGANIAQQKMSFASAPNRVYFDVGNIGYWSDMTNLLLVDWVPPSAGAAGGGFNSSAGNFSANTSSNYGFSLSTATNIGGVSSTITCVNVVTAGPKFPVSLALTVTAHLIVGGVSAGTSTSKSVNETVPAGGTTTFTNIFNFGNQTSLWGIPTLTPAQVNASNFGVVYVQNHGTLNTPFVTAYQQSVGFVAGTGTTGTLTGTYTWKLTFVAANGEESDASLPSSTIILSGQQGTLTGIPLGDGRTVGRNIYRKGSILTSYYLVGSIPDDTTTTFSDNLTDIAALTAGTILAGDVPGDFPNTRFNDGPSGGSGRYPVYHYDRVFWVNQNQQNEIFWSKPLNGFAYPVVNFIDVGDSKPIVRLISIFGELIIIKTDSIWRLTGTDETSFDLTQTPSAVGTDMPFTIAPLPDKILFANRWGLWVFNGYTSQPLTTKLDLWFKQDDRTNEELFGLNGFHPPEVASQTIPTNFDATGNSEKFYLAYAEAGQAANNALLAFDVKHGNITKREPGTPLPLSLAIDPVTGFVYMGDNAGFVSLLDDYNGATGGGAAVNFDFQSGYIDLQRGSNKAIWALEFFLDTDGQALTPSVYYDGGTSSEILPPISTTSLQRVVRPLGASTARKMQNFSWRLNGSINPVNVNGQPQIQIVHVKALFDIRTGRARTGQ